MLIKDVSYTRYVTVSRFTVHIVQRYRSPSTYPPQTTGYHML